MAESIETVNTYNLMATREERARVFFSDCMTQGEIEEAHETAKGYVDLERPMARTAVMIPVAAHQDAGHIWHTLGEYAKQRNAEPFTVFLYLNTPEGPLADDALSAAESEVEYAKETFPHLDIRSCKTTYNEPTIGMIRGHMWAGVGMLALYEGLFAPGSDDVIGINNDIDTTYISPHYISRIQSFYKIRHASLHALAIPESPLRAVGTRVMHATLATHPNVAKVTQWIDNSYFQAPEHVSYEAGIVIPFSHYFSNGGFNPEAETHETSWVSPDRNLYHLTGAQLYTSPRRYIERLQKHDTTEIWTPGSFGHSDVCRAHLPPDLSADRAEELIFDRLHDDINKFWMSGALYRALKDVEELEPFKDSIAGYDDLLEQQANHHVFVQLNKAVRLLRHVIRSDLLADILQDTVESQDYYQRRVASIVKLQRLVNESSSIDTDDNGNVVITLAKKR